MDRGSGNLSVVSWGREPRRCLHWVCGLSSCQGAVKSLLPSVPPHASSIASSNEMPPAQSATHSSQCWTTQGNEETNTDKAEVQMMQGKVDWVIEACSLVDKGEQEDLTDDSAT